jgi:hypothetical protein
MLKALTLTLAGTLPLLLSSSPAEAAPRRFPTAIVGLEVQAVDGGINPSHFALQVSGKVELGGNPCQAAGRRVTLVKARRGDVIEASAVITEAPGAAQRVCTLEYAPQFVAVQGSVRGSWERVRDVVVKNAEELGHDVSARDYLGHNDLVVHDVQVTPGNGGINPDAFAFVVKASVMKGSNPCVAANTQVRFLQQRVGDQIQLRAVRRTIDPARRCTMEYNPKFVTLTTTVRAFASQTRSVIIKNVDERGHDVDARDFL